MCSIRPAPKRFAGSLKTRLLVAAAASKSGRARTQPSAPVAVLRPAPHARGAGCRHRPARAHDDLAGVDRALRPPPEDRTLDAPDLALRLGHRRRHLLDALSLVRYREERRRFTRVARASAWRSTRGGPQRGGFESATPSGNALRADPPALHTARRSNSTCPRLTLARRSSSPMTSQHVGVLRIGAR